MKAKPKPRLSLADAVYEAIADLEDASDAQLIRHVSKLCGKRITGKQFKRAVASLGNRP